MLITPEDFTVEIKNLPKPKKYKSVKELKILLWNHVESVIKRES